MRSSIRGLASFGILIVLAASSPALFGASLSGSRSSLHRQNDEAVDHDFTYLRDASQVEGFVRAGYLVRVDGNSNYELIDVSYPYARPEVRTFIERLSRQYRASCGEKLVITSLTRPYSDQPGNASPLSVHPTGMAIDVRRSNSRACRSWIEKTLLVLEGRKVLEATREKHPPHYHVAVYPKKYSDYVRTLGRQSGGSNTHRVAGGDSLWSIARTYGTTVTSIQRVNGLASSRLTPGQVLKIPR